MIKRSRPRIHHEPHEQEDQEFTTEFHGVSRRKEEEKSSRRGAKDAKNAKEEEDQEFYHEPHEQKKMGYTKKKNMINITVLKENYMPVQYRGHEEEKTTKKVGTANEDDADNV